MQLFIVIVHVFKKFHVSNCLYSISNQGLYSVFEHVVASMLEQLGNLAFFLTILTAFHFVHGLSCIYVPILFSVCLKISTKRQLLWSNYRKQSKFSSKMSLCNLVSFRNIRNAKDGRWVFKLKNVENNKSIKNKTGFSEKCFARFLNSEFWDTFASTTKPS